MSGFGGPLDLAPEEPAAATPKPQLPGPLARHGRPLTDLGVVALAAAVAAGAWWAAAVPLPLGLAAASAGLVARRPALLVLGGLLLSAALGQRAHAGLHPPGLGRFEGVVTAVSDPAEQAFSTRVDVRIRGKRVEVQARGSAAGALDAVLAGERLRVRGRLRRAPADAPWLLPRHVSAVLVAEEVERVGAGSAGWRAANRFRRLLERGTAGLPEQTRVLYRGFVLGDDRGQRAEIVDDFRGAGLSHLLVVSGQNVALALLLVAPLCSRFGWRGRWGLTLAVVAAFAVVTRGEPSVLRASAMAAVAVTAAARGRPATGLRLLGLAVSGAILVDPLLVHAVAFQLSVAASAGLVVGAGTLARRLPGPRWLAQTLGATLAAQLAVAPVLIPRFGAMPVVAVPANVLAVPVSGLATTWGLPAGVAAGLAADLAGGRVARLLHLPTRAALAWVALVARQAAAVPLGELGLGGLALVVAGTTAALVLAGRPRWAPVRVVGALVAALALATPAWQLAHPPPNLIAGAGATVTRVDGATVVELRGGSPPARVLEALRRAGVRRIDLLVLDRRADPELLRALRHRWPVGRVQVPP